MRRGFPGLSAQVQIILKQQPFSGHVFVFRGRRGDTIKILWADEDGLCLFAKRLVRSRFIWPQAKEESRFRKFGQGFKEALKNSLIFMVSG